MPIPVAPVPVPVPVVLIPIAKVRDVVEEWPYNPDGTYRLIKLGRLGCVRVGRNVFVTKPLIDAFIAAHTVGGAA